MWFCSGTSADVIKRKETPARDRMKAYRQRIKADPEKHSDKLKKDKQRKKIARQRERDRQESLTPRMQKSIALEARMKAAERQRKCRQRKNGKNGVISSDESDDNITPSKVFPTRQAAGKALKRLRVKLPFSPRKRKAVTLKLALEEGNKLEEIKSKSRKDCIPDEVKNKVTSFYNRDDISWAAPGTRDVSILRTTEGIRKCKTIIQKIFMMINVMEAHQIFKEENPDDKVGKSKFFEYRPKNIHNMADIPHNVCICKTHGNMDGMLGGIF